LTREVEAGFQWKLTKLRNLGRVTDGQMNMKNLILILAFIALIPSATLAQSTAFTFQGRLNDGSAAATGNEQQEIRL
jgi:hypothetical protein